MQPEDDRFGPRLELNGPPDGFAVGTVLYGRFLIEKDLSDPSMGGGFTSLRVKDLKEYCREAVLKISVSSPEGLDTEGPTITDVAAALNRLAHPNLEDFHETGRFANGRPFALTSVYDTATPLNRFAAEDRRLELSVIAQLVGQIVSGLGAAHAKGILHCDLRPANVLVPEGDLEQNSLKIINFGSAWPVDARGESLCRLRPGAESLHYAAPELLVALGHRSPVSDIYSLAVLIYRLVTGVLPFAGDERKSQLNAIHGGLPEPPGDRRTDLSSQAWGLILAGLQFEPALRPQHIQDYGRRLRDALSPPRGIIVRADGPQQIAGSSHETDGPASSKIAESEPAPLFEKYIASTATAVTSAGRPGISERTLAWGLIILLIAGSLSIPIVQIALKGRTEAAQIEPAPSRPPIRKTGFRLRYWFESSRLPFRDTPGPDSGTGDRLVFVADAGGEAYIFSEFNGDDGRPSYRLIFPASGQVAADASTGPEKAARAAAVPSAGLIWIVWMPGVDNDLRSILAAASPEGNITTDDGRRLLRHFLERNRGLGLTERSDPSTGEMSLEGSAGKIVYRLDLDAAGSQRRPAGPGEQGRLVRSER
ncbi:MAG: protein kinase [Acidobacteria bacterium]|nr:protein kinase [Acidobacteriota bacterium]